MFIHQTYSDAMEQENALPGWRQEYRQLSGGSYTGEVKAVMLPGVEIYRERINVATEQLFSAPKDRTIFFYYPKLDGTQLVKDEPLKSTTGFALNWIDRIGFMSVESDLLMVAFEQVQYPSREKRKSGSIQGCLAKEGEFLGEWLSSLVGAGELALGDEVNPTTKSVIAGVIQDRLDLLFEKSELYDPPAVVDSEHIYRRLREYLHEVPSGDMPNVRSLAFALNIDARALRQLCRAFAGVPIEQLLTRLRLNGAHRELKTGLSQGKTVSQIAMNWGFTHWGRFAARYSELFGVSPSTTLRNGC